MKTRIHVDQHAVKRNVKGANDPVITVKDYRQNRKGQTAVIRDTNGIEVARIVYRPEHPLSCGARVWIETDLNVELI